MCGMQVIGVKNPSLERDSKVFLNLSVPLPRLIFHARSDRCAGEKVGSSSTTKRPAGSALVSPTAAALRCTHCAAHHAYIFAKSTMVRLMAVVPHEENCDALYQLRGSRVTRYDGRVGSHAWTENQAIQCQSDSV